jgi:hypothetical protein
MTRRLYLAPIVTLPIGIRAPLASKVLEYGRLPNISSVLSRDKTWCISSADFDDAHHTLVAADPAIVSIPFGSLDNTWNDFSVNQRAAIGERLEALRVPLDWISAGTSVADLLRHATRTALLGQMLKADALDDVSLDSTFGQIPAARRNRILNWCANNGVDTTGLSGSTTIRAMLRALVLRFPWNAGHELPFMRDARAERFSITAQILQGQLRRGEIRLEDLPFVAQASASDDFSGTLSNWTSDSGTWAIVSGALQMTNLTDDIAKIRYTATTPASNDYYVEADIACGDTSTATQGPGVAGRLANGTGDANSDGYTYSFYNEDASYLIELTNSAEAVLDTGSAVAVTTYTNCRLTCNGSALTGTRNGAADVSGTDATYASGGWGCTWGDFSNVVGSIDNWEAADLTAVTTSFPFPSRLKALQSVYMR